MSSIAVSMDALVMTSEIQFDFTCIWDVVTVGTKKIMACYMDDIRIHCMYNNPMLYLQYNDYLHIRRGASRAFYPTDK
jgi:hypothetical protein